MAEINKKGQGLVELFSWFLALLFTLIFFILFNLPGCDGDIPDQRLEGADLDALEDEFTLASFLRTPVTVEGAEISMAELIILRKENDRRYKSVLQEKATEIMRPIRERCSSVSAKQDIYQWTTFFGNCGDSPLASCSPQEQILPYPGGNMTVHICIHKFWWE